MEGNRARGVTPEPMTTERDTAALRALAEAATPGPWQPLTHGTASQRDAAGRAYEAVIAVHVEDNPDIQFTDLSWVDREDGVHIALVGNGPRGPENSKFIAAVDPQTVLALLDRAERAEKALEKYGTHKYGCDWTKGGGTDDPVWLKFVDEWAAAGEPCQCGLKDALAAAVDAER